MSCYLVKCGSKLLPMKEKNFSLDTSMGLSIRSLPSAYLLDLGCLDLGRLSKNSLTFYFPTIHSIDLINPSTHLAGTKRRGYLVDPVRLKWSSLRAGVSWSILWAPFKSFSRFETLLVPPNSNAPCTVWRLQMPMGLWIVAIRIHPFSYSFNNFRFVFGPSIDTRIILEVSIFCT